MILLPDEQIAAVYNDVEPNIKQAPRWPSRTASTCTTTRSCPRADLDVWMVAPKAQATPCARPTRKGGGVPHLIASTPTSPARRATSPCPTPWPTAAAKAGIIETNFREETETDLFGEQAVLCGGTVELIKMGYETLVEAGYAPEMAYFECLHELKLIVDLIYEGGIANMNYSISNNAEYGEYVTGPRVVTAETKKVDEAVLKDIQTGEYAKSFILRTAPARRRCSRAAA